MGKIVSMTGVRKIYSTGSVEVRALDGIDLEIKDEEYVAIMGASGSGKTTLMNVMGCLDQLSSGQYELGGQRVENMSERQLARVRNERIGFVFQAYNLLPRFSALENVELPLIYRRVGLFERRRTALDMLGKVGLKERAHHRPHELSGGEQQRVAIARALIADPVMLLADEPTGNLDSKTEADILALMDDLKSQGRTIVMVTHERNVAERAGRIVMMKDGQIIDDTVRSEDRWVSMRSE